MTCFGFGPCINWAQEWTRLKFQVCTLVLVLECLSRSQDSMSNDGFDVIHLIIAQCPIHCLQYSTLNHYLGRWVDQSWPRTSTTKQALLIATIRSRSMRFTSLLFITYNSLIFLILKTWINKKESLAIDWMDFLPIKYRWLTINNWLSLIKKTCSYSFVYQIINLKL